jgi:hypothetical protein
MDDIIPLQIHDTADLGGMALREPGYVLHLRCGCSALSCNHPVTEEACTAFVEQEFMPHGDAPGSGPDARAMATPPQRGMMPLGSAMNSAAVARRGAE